MCLSISLVLQEAAARRAPDRRLAKSRAATSAGAILVVGVRRKNRGQLVAGTVGAEIAAFYSQTRTR